jgi:hypothetical protein
MVAFEKYSKMSMEEKAWYLWNGGSFLMAYESDRFRFNLFKISNYYVELVYNLQTNDIEKIRAFFTEALLSPYLQKIDISELLE